MGTAGIDLGSHAHGASKCLKGSLDDVVGVDAIELADMKGHEAVVDDGHEEFAYQLGVVGADALGGDFKTVGKVGATGEVEGDLN